MDTGVIVWPFEDKPSKKTVPLSEQIKDKFKIDKVPIFKNLLCPVACPLSSANNSACSLPQLEFSLVIPTRKSLK